MNKRTIPLKPIEASIVLGLGYQIKLKKLFNEMYNDFYDSIISDYTTLKDKALDANFKTNYNSLFKTWFKKFTNLSRLYSTKFIQDVSYDTRQQLISGAKDLITIEPDNHYKRVVLAKKTLIDENVGLITNLSTDMYKGIKQVLNQAVLKGTTISPQQLIDMGLPAYKKDLDLPLNELKKKILKRAKLISRDQLFKSTNQISSARLIDAGLILGEWLHSHGDKVPRPSHLKANGTIYDIRKGCLIDGEYIQPAEKINCTCTMIPHIEIN